MTRLTRTQLQTLPTQRAFGIRRKDPAFRDGGEVLQIFERTQIVRTNPRRWKLDRDARRVDQELARLSARIKVVHRSGAL